MGESAPIGAPDIFATRNGVAGLEGPCRAAPADLEGDLEPRGTGSRNATGLEQFSQGHPLQARQSAEVLQEMLGKFHGPGPRRAPL